MIGRTPIYKHVIGRGPIYKHVIGRATQSLSSELANHKIGTDVLLANHKLVFDVLVWLA